MDKEAKILVVDDDPLVLRGFEEILLREGLDVVSVGDGQKALHQIETTPFDLVLTDLVMRDVHGLAVLKKTQQCQPDAIVIVITGFASTHSAIEALRLGAYDYLMKPCEDSELVLRVRHALEKIRLQRDLRARELEDEKMRAIVQTAVAVNDQVNTPLNVILGSTEYLRLKLQPSDPEILQSFDFIRQEVGKIKGVIQKLAHIANPKVKEYALGKIQMVDLESSDTRPTLSSSASRKRRILIVDDDQFMVHTLSRILTLLDFETVGAFGGRQALDIMHEESVDLVLSDIHMPEMNGLQLMDTVKQANPHLPVVLITGYSVDNTPTDFRHTQADALLYKPFKIADLKQTIETALGMGLSYAGAMAHP